MRRYGISRTFEVTRYFEVDAESKEKALSLTSEWEEDRDAEFTGNVISTDISDLGEADEDDEGEWEDEDEWEDEEEDDEDSPS